MANFNAYDHFLTYRRGVPNMSRDLLNNIFHPTKSKRPKGLRKTQVSGSNWKASRRRSFNSMDAVKQNTIRAAGQFESYLKGDTTLADARNRLRTDAIQQGIARPTKGSTIGDVVEKLFSFASERPERYNMGGDDYHAEVSKKTIRGYVGKMDKETLAAAKGIGSYEELAGLASDDNLIDEDGNNPFWYHDM